MRRLALLPLLGAARVGVPPDQRLAAHAEAVVPDPFPVFLKLKKSGSATAKRALFGRICDRGRWFWKGRCGEYQGERAPLIYGVGGRAALATCLGDKLNNAAEDAVDRGWEVHVNYDKTIRIPVTAPVAPIRVFVVVREPVARLVSAFYFFGPREAPAEPSLENVSRAVRCRWQGCRVHGNLQPSPLAVLSQTYAAPAYDVGAALARAAANIRRDDVVVGTFDRLETFLKVAVLEIGGVRPERVCVGHVHGGARDRTALMMRAWPAAAHAAAADWLKGDAALYALADRVFAERVARWGTAVAATRLCPRPVRGPCANAPG